MKTNTEDEPKRIQDNEATGHQKFMKVMLRGMFGYSSHSNPDNKKKFDPVTFAPGTIDQALGYIPRATIWYVKRNAQQNLTISR